MPRHGQGCTGSLRCVTHATEAPATVRPVRGRGRLDGVDVSERTQDQAPEDTPTTAGYCSWHQRIVDSVRRIQLTEAGSGGKVHYACRHCIRIFKLTPYEDR